MSLSGLIVRKMQAITVCATLQCLALVFQSRTNDRSREMCSVDRVEISRQYSAW